MKTSPTIPISKVAVLPLIFAAHLSSAALVGEWNFDGDLTNSGTTGATHDASGTVTYSNDTFSGSGQSLVVTPSSGFVTVNNTDSDIGGYVDTFDAATEFTFSMRIKSTDGTWTQWSEFASKGNEGSSQTGSNAGWSLRARNATGTNGNDGIGLHGYGAGAVVDPDDETTNFAASQDWYLLTYTYDTVSDNLVLYIDGAEVNSGTIALSSGAAYSLSFGGRYDGSRSENILIDSVQFYDTALSAGQVAALVPEPSAYALIAGFLGLASVAIRRRK